MHTCLGVQVVPWGVGGPGVDDANHAVRLHMLFKNKDHRRHHEHITLFIKVMDVEAEISTTSYPKLQDKML